jgi:hypothetical protein
MRLSRSVSAAASRASAWVARIQRRRNSDVCTEGGGLRLCRYEVNDVMKVDYAATFDQEDSLRPCRKVKHLLVL